MGSALCTRGLLESENWEGLSDLCKRSLEAIARAKLQNDFTVTGNECFHDGPSDKIGCRTNTENNKVPCRFPCKSQKGHLSIGCVIKQNSGKTINHIRGNHPCRSAYPGDGSYGAFGKHIPY